MKKTTLILSIFLLFSSTIMKGADSTFLDYQNYNHGYCPDCSCLPCKCDGCNNEPACADDCADPCTAPCDSCNPCVAEPCAAPCDPCNPCGPCAPVCGTECGISICAIGVGLVAAAIAAAIIATAGDPGSSNHSHS